jgi:hypothetical protein
MATMRSDQDASKSRSCFTTPRKIPSDRQAGSREAIKVSLHCTKMREHCYLVFQCLLASYSIHLPTTTSCDSFFLFSPCAIACECLTFYMRHPLYKADTHNSSCQKLNTSISLSKDMSAHGRSPSALLIIMLLNLLGNLLFPC